MGLSIESGPEALLPTTSRYRVTAAMVGCRTGNSLGIGSGGYVAVQVPRGGLLPADCPPADVAKLLYKGQVEPVGEVDGEVAAELERVKAAHYRPPDAAPTPRERLAEAAWRAGIHAGEPLVEFLAAVEALIDERVAAALEGRSADA